jgi:hypothetical protein
MTVYTERNLIEVLADLAAIVFLYMCVAVIVLGLFLYGGY